jgi:predicted metal-dependent phosphoesterase TrpH
MRIANCDAPGRPHIGRALVEAGHCRNLDESFQKWLKKGKPAWVPKAKLSAAEAIRLIHDADGLAVLAHPGLYHRDEVIPPLVDLGMDGLECLYTRHSTPMTEHYLMLAEQYDLLVTGGSDCHGENKGKPLIGGVKVPVSFIEKMKSAVAA